jgi:hypothetical protein
VPRKARIVDDRRARFLLVVPFGQVDRLVVELHQAVHYSHLEPDERQEEKGEAIAGHDHQARQELREPCGRPQEARAYDLRHDRDHKIQPVHRITSGPAASQFRSKACRIT